MAAAAAALATATFTPAASAAVSCDQAGTTVTVAMTAGDNVTFLRGPGRELLVNGAQCGTATTENTETVTVSGVAGAEQQVFVDLAAGPFVSLQRETGPPGGTSIRFHVDLGGDWDDTLLIDGTAGADTIVAGANGITLDQTSPVGELDVLFAGIDILALRGRGEDDVLSGAGSAATGAPVGDPVWVQLYGQSGDDTLLGDHPKFVPGPGDDTMTAQGAASLDYASAAAPVKVDLAAGTATGEGNDTFSGVGGVWGSGFADELVGDGADNVLNGRAGSDLIRGAGGDDQIIGSFGDDTLDGESGSDAYPDWYVLYETDDDTIADSGAGTGDVDTADFYGAPTTVSVDLAAGTATGVGADTLAGIETVRGTNGADTLLGSSRGETLLGMGGDDVLAGRGGPDMLVGGEGADLLDGGPGRDTADYATAPSAVTVDLASGKAARGAGNDSLLGLENVIGSPFADVLRGSAAANVLRGGGGRDTLRGAAGSDRLYGMSGSDVLYGAAGNDVLSGGSGTRDRCYQGGGRGRRLGCELP